ncbi:response regulator [Parabacteroides sp. PF5-9]|uniref:response regulator n=1 Tax=Parabacteroides sp. PF5-9 TaxID=1742404 RepID=UPI00247494ED|nr:response regulator [Parabacteroides sp. PF5-9]MDH6357368.1 DNA-binding NarL/FixJ family response regulator [Parabacteroides sp. PF5-9]
MVSVHIVEDHKMLVEWLCLSIRNSGKAEICDVSYTLTECKKTLTIRRPDILLLDLILPDGSGVDFCQEIIQKYPEQKILILSTHNEYSIIKTVLNAGVAGYILKSELTEEVLIGLEKVMEGEIFLSTEVKILMQKRVADQRFRLTPREKQVLKLVVEGYRSRDIGEQLFITTETVNGYRKSGLQKIGAKNAIELVNMVKDGKIVL